MKRIKYILEYAILRILWIVHDPEKRKPWKDVKSCIGHKDHKYDGPITTEDGYPDYKFIKCSHPGCNMMIPIEYI